MLNYEIAIIFCLIISLIPIIIFYILRSTIREQVIKKIVEKKGLSFPLVIVSFIFLEFIALCLSGLGLFSIFADNFDLGLVQKIPLKIESEPLGSLLINNRYFGKTPASVFVKRPGIYKIRIESVSGYLPAESIVVVNRGGENKYKFKLTKAVIDKKISEQNAISSKIERKLVPIGYVASSIGKDTKRNIVYYPSNVGDGKRETCWAEGVKGDGIGEWIQLSFDKSYTVTKIGIIPGYDKWLNDDIGDRFYKNSRLKKGTLRFSNDKFLCIECADSRLTQYFKIPNIKTTYIMLTINEIYRGSKWDDLSISEIEVYGY